MTAPLTGTLVVELGDRISAGACGSLLAQLGASVVLIEPDAADARNNTKWAHRPLFAAGKESLVISDEAGSDAGLLAALLQRCDVALTSSDLDSNWMLDLVERYADHAIRCDISAFGASSPQPNAPLTDAALQALTGLIDTTGEEGKPPILTQVPIVEITSATWAAAATVAALRVRRMQGIAQRVEVAMYDCAITMLATFLPKHFAGQESQRIGNRHPSIAPWNCFRTSDGWIQLCTGTEDQWLRLAKLLEADGLTPDPRYNERPERLRFACKLDALIAQWTRRLTSEVVLARLGEAGIPGGPVCTINELLADPNLLHRGMVRDLTNPVTGDSVRVPGNLFSRCGWHVDLGASIPPRNARANAIEHLPRSRSEDAASRKTPDGKAAHPSLAGIRVLEIGQWTTAPLAARLLGSLGADVIKLEMPGGDPARGSPPLRHGESYLFNLNNSEKRCITIDMRTEQGKADFEALLAQCDVLVENLKPGSLSRLGYSFARLSELNPQIICCAISGFGADSVYPGRAAMDTVLQAVCAVMDLTRQSGIPYKTGVSLSDLMGGHFGLLAILSALEERSRSKTPQFLDLSMQDITAWATQTNWNAQHPGGSDDCYAVVESGGRFVLAPHRATILRRSQSSATLDASDTFKKEDAGELQIPVRAVAEVAVSPETTRRRLIIESEAANGRTWPLVATPIRLEATPARVTKAPLSAENIFWLPKE